VSAQSDALDAAIAEAKTFLRDSTALLTSRAPAAVLADTSNSTTSRITLLTNRLDALEHSTKAEAQRAQTEASVALSLNLKELTKKIDACAKRLDQLRAAGLT